MLRIPSDTISVADYCNDSSIAKHSRYNRRFALRQLATANGKETAEEIIEDIKTEKVTLYVASRRMVDEMRKRMKPSTVFQYRSILPEMFRAVLGEDNFRKTVFDRLVPRGEYYIYSIKKVTTIDELKQMLDIATPLYTALVGGLACGGVRIGESGSPDVGDL